MAGFAATVASWAKDTETDARDALAKICLDLFAGVLKNTRVDTGRLRGSWRMNLGTADTSVEDENTGDSPPGQGSPPTGAELGYALGVTGTIQLGDVIVISNSLPYAEVIDDEDKIVADTVAEVLENLEEALAEIRRAS